MPFKKGQSGNPNGRPRSQTRAIANLAFEARKHSVLALKTLVDICKKGETESSRMAAANAILDRGFGRPTQSIDLSADNPVVQFNLFSDFDPLEQGLLRDALKSIEAEQRPAIEHRAPMSADEPESQFSHAGA
jgi:Family of unknown function (DUF5681)